MIDPTPIRRYCLRALRFNTGLSFKDISTKSWILAGASQNSKVRPAIFLDGHLDRVTDVSRQHTSLQHELKRVQGYPVDHPPTTAYLIQDARLIGSFIYKDSMKHVLAPRRENLLPKVKVEIEELERVALASTYCGNVFFGHFIRDDLTLTIAVQDLAKPISTNRKPYFHEGEYRNIFNLYSHITQHAHCRELIIVDDVSQNAYKRERYDKLRSQIRRVSSFTPHPGIFIKRGQSVLGRGLENESEIESSLLKLGFKVIDPERMSIKEIIETALGARIIVAVEGSALVHGFLTMIDGGTIVALQPPYRFNNIYKDIADCMDMYYGFVVGTRSSNGFVIDSDELLRLLDSIEAKSHKASSF